MADMSYWATRALQRENEAYLEGVRLTGVMFREYQAAARSIRQQINDFYSRYAGQHGLTFDQAVRLLSRSEFREWKASLGEYVARIAQEPDPKIKALLTAQLDALSANSSISRLDALLGQIDMKLNDLFDQGVAQMKAQFGDSFREGYYKKVYDIQSRAGFINEFAKLNEGMVEGVLTYPWSGAMFSDRLWQNKQALLFHLRETITQGVMQGKSVGSMAKDISAKMGQSYKAAERLVRTEMAHFHGESDKAAYKAAGVKEYEFVATLDERTCSVCGALDGQHFPLDEAEEGVNYPPMHPNDRCTTVEYDPDDALDWYNSGKPMPKNMTYEEWYDQQVAEHGPGYVETQREKAYNQKADAAQFSRYADRLGADAPGGLEAFQEMKYNDPEAWTDLKSFYSYKGRVGEATRADFDTYKRIRATGIYGTVRVPPAPIDLDALTLDAAHIAARGHGVTLDEAKSFIQSAGFSLKRKHWSGDFLNYYSTEGAAYVRADDGVIRTAFKKAEFDAKTEKAVKAMEGST